jgi:hypothetical protein
MERPLIEKSPEVERISKALTGWFRGEIRSSRTGHNAVLDDFATWHQRLTMLTKDSANGNYLKSSSHVGRLRMFTEQGFVRQPWDDQTFAKQIFCAQMFVSGLFRNECMLISSSQEEYYERRSGKANPVGITIARTAGKRLRQLKDAGRNPAFQPTTDPALTFGDLAERTHFMNNRMPRVLQLLHTHGGREAGQEQSPTLTVLREMQGDWVSLITDYALYAAQTREGGLADVPFWEPKSISDNPQIYYPFREVEPTAA